jgi:hypothetical protein
MRNRPSLPRTAAALLVTALGAGAALRAGDADAPKPVTANAAQQAHLGVVTQPLTAAEAPAGIATTARVLDPGPLIQLDSELSAAAAALNASRAEAERTRKLYSEDRTASARALETAQAQAQADQLRVAAGQRRLLLEWGGGVAGLSAQQRAALLNDLAHVRTELVRVELPAETPVPAAGAIIRLQGGVSANAMQAKALGMLPAADPRLQTRGLLAQLRGPQVSLAVGQMLSAQLPAAAAGRGVVLPRAALLRKDAQVWVYVQSAPDTFVRREVKDYRPLSAGWFVPAGFSPGERIVTAGAGALLGVETPAAGGGD